MTNRQAVDNMSPDRVMMKREEKETSAIPPDGFRHEQLIAIANWARSNPTKWDTVCLKLRNSALTCRQIGKAIGIDPRTVRRHFAELKRELSGV